MLTAYIVGVSFVAWAFRQNYFRLLPFFTLYWVITFPFKFVLYDYYPDYAVGGYVGDAGIRESALAWSLVYYFGVCLSYFFFSRHDLVRPVGIVLYRRSVFLFLWLVSLSIFAFFNFNLVFSGRLISYLSSRNESYAGDGFFKVFGSTMLLMSTVVLLIDAFVRYGGCRSRNNLAILRRWVFVSLFVGVVFLFVEMVRGKMFFIIIAITYSYHQYVARLSRRLLLVLASGSFVLVGLLSQIKYTLVTGRFFSETDVGLVERFIGGALVTFDSSDHLNRTLERLPFFNVNESWYQPFVDPLLAMIPRVLWADKPMAFGGVKLQEYIYPDLTADTGVVSSYYSVSGVGEAIMLGGGVGVVFLSIYVGFVICFFENINKRNPMNGMLYVMLLASLFNIARAGVFGLNSILLNMLVFLSVVWLLEKMLRPIIVTYNFRVR